MSVLPEQFHRRSFVYPRVLGAGAELASIGDAAVAVTYPGKPAPWLGLADLSPLPRTGVKGPRALEWLRELGWPVPESNNASVATAAGRGRLRLGDREALVAAAPSGDGESVRRLDAAIPGGGAWQVPRRDSHCAFALRGDDAVTCLNKLCGVDLRRHAFPTGSIAQTSVGRLNAIVCRDPAAGKPDLFHLLADSASAIWFWDVLLDAMAEFGGGPVGTRDLGQGNAGYP